MKKSKRSNFNSVLCFLGELARRGYDTINLIVQIEIFFKFK